MTQVDFYDKTQIDAMNVGKETDTASASGSLWARLKDALNKIASKADASNVYTKTEIDTTLSNYATKTYVDGQRTIVQLSADNYVSTLQSLKVGDNLIVQNYIDLDSGTNRLVAFEMTVTGVSASAISGVASGILRRPNETPSETQLSYISITPDGQTYAYYAVGVGYSGSHEFTGFQNYTGAIAILH